MTWVQSFFTEFWLLLCQMAPYLLFGFALAGILSEFLTPARVERSLGRRGLGSIIKAALIGIPLPLCSCGVIPVTAAIRKHGASKGATVSFLTSTPQTGIDSLIVTWSMLGWVFAFFRPVAAFVSGVLTGFLAEQLDRESATTIPEIPPPKAKPSCCHQKESVEDVPRRPEFRRMLRYGFVVLFDDVAGSLLAGLTLATVITLAIPDDWFGRIGESGIAPMLVAMIIGIPLYVCSTASVPMALAMMSKGLSPGATLVFLMAGTATNAATVTTVWKILGHRTTVIYLLGIAGCSLAAGGILDLIYHRLPPEVVTLPCHEGTSPFSMVCGILLLGMIARSLIKRIRVGKHLPES
jgi:uncharacterized membrane protein YraQ (UPF0718 family)